MAVHWWPKGVLVQGYRLGQEAGLKLMIDLHGAPGSQNGYDNSGQKLDTPGWAYDQGKVDWTKQIVESISREFSDPQYFGVVTGLVSWTPVFSFDVCMS